MLMAIAVSRNMLVMQEIVSAIGLFRATLSSASFRIANPSEMHAGLPASLIIVSASNTFARAISRGVEALLVLVSEEDIIECGFDARMLVRGIECERGSRSTTVVTKLSASHGRHQAVRVESAVLSYAIAI
jgi:hypothetical protein